MGSTPRDSFCATVMKCDSAVGGGVAVVISRLGFKGGETLAFLVKVGIWVTTDCGPLVIDNSYRGRVLKIGECGCRDPGVWSFFFIALCQV